MKNTTYQNDHPQSLGFYPWLFCAICWLLGTVSGYSTHIVGGDISYRCLGNQKYEITLTLRRDCLNGSPQAQFDDPAYVGIFDNRGTLVRNLGRNGVLDMAFRHDDTLNEILVKSCGIVGGDVCVHTTSYVDTLELPFRAGGYLLAYQRCCRNFSIRNIVDPLEAGATYTVELTEDALIFCNSSPVLAEYPPIYLCGGQPIYFDQKARDAEGDSLVYRLCVPYLGANQQTPRPLTPSSPPYDLVQFSGNYRLEDMIGGTPPLNMAPSTGIMTGFAEAIVAQYLIAYCVEEYRDGKLLSVLRRDFQINVRLCSSVPIANFSTMTNVCSGTFNIKCTDQSHDLFAQVVGWNWFAELNGKLQLSSSKDPEFAFQDTGTLKLTLVITSSESCKDTFNQWLTLVHPGPNVDFRSDTICRMDSVELRTRLDSGFQYQWTPPDGLSCLNCPHPKASPSQNTRYVLHAKREGCEIWDTVDIVVKNCIVDPCIFFVEERCLPGGMVELKAVDGFGHLIQPASRQFELFWNILPNNRHSGYALQNQNPIQLMTGEFFRLTGKYYSWEAGKPHRIEFADICERKIQDTVATICSGPCDSFNFILSSCEDDYDKSNNLNFPPSICESICGGACQYIIALFESDGRLIDPNAYEIVWSDGSTGAYIHRMGPYYNNVWAEVRKGDCSWRGKYIKQCSQFGKFHHETESLNSRSHQANRLAKKDCLGTSQALRIYSMTGVPMGNSTEDLPNLPPGIYLLIDHVNGQSMTIKWIVD